MVPKGKIIPYFQVPFSILFLVLMILLSGMMLIVDGC